MLTVNHLQASNLVDYFSSKALDEVLIVPTNSAFEDLFKGVDISKRAFLRDKTLVTKV